MKKQFLFFLTLGMLFSLSAQVPSYVPTKGLVGWWPFNGNANDESGNGNNGTVNGATLVVDRLGNTNKAYNFNGTSNYIEIADNSSLDFVNSYSISVWVKISDYSLNQNATYPQRTMISKPRPSSPNVTTGMAFRVLEGAPYWNNNSKSYVSAWTNTTVNNGIGTSDSVQLSIWCNLVFTYDGTVAKLFKNGVKMNSVSASYSLLNTAESLFFGKEHSSNTNNARWFKGQLDDIGLWNRALDSNEIMNLYKSCTKTETHPSDLSVVTTKNAIFNAKHTDSTYTAIWQSKHVDMPWNNLVSNNTYTLKNKTLTIKNVTVSNHNQKIRVIYKNQNCLDTSTTATLSILDTCINSVYDTIAVLDTLIINAKLTGTTPLQTNLIKVYPNPAKDYLVLDFGNYTSMSGYEVIIIDASGKSVYSSIIKKQLESIDINTWSGTGIYFIRIFDKQGNRIENKKIIIQ